MRGKSAKRLIVAIVLAAFAASAAWAVTLLKSMQDLEAEAYDIRVLAFSPETKASDRIVMVWLDEATMAGLPYRSPVPRDFLAKLHKQIVAAEPWLVGYDIFFADSSFPDADREFAKALGGSVTYAVVPRRPDGTVAMPLPMFADALVGVGLADLPFNPFDATVRVAKLSYDTDRGMMDSFGAEIFGAAAGVAAADAREARP